MVARARALARAAAEYGDEHPEWWVLVPSAAAWIAMLPHALAAGASCHQLSFWADWRDWVLMVVAMMLPLMLQSVRWAAERSFRSRQRRAMAGYVIGYLMPWVTLGLGVAWLLGQPWIRKPWTPPLAFALAAVWAATPWYERFMGDSHRSIPLAPRGWRADRDCVRFGVRQGVPCVAACALMMLGCTLTGHGLVAMVGGAAIGARERLSWQQRPWAAPAGCAALAVWYAFAAWRG